MNEDGKLAAKAAATGCPHVMCEGDQHLTCWRCRIIDGYPICHENNRCEQCIDMPSAVFAKIKHSYQKSTRNDVAHYNKRKRYRALNGVLPPPPNPNVYPVRGIPDLVIVVRSVDPTKPVSIPADAAKNSTIEDETALLVKDVTPKRKKKVFKELSLPKTKRTRTATVSKPSPPTTSVLGTVTVKRKIAKPTAAVHRLALPCKVIVPRRGESSLNTSDCNRLHLNPNYKDFHENLSKLAIILEKTQQPLEIMFPKDVVVPDLHGSVSVIKRMFGFQEVSGVPEADTEKQAEEQDADKAKSDPVNEKDEGAKVEEKTEESSSKVENLATTETVDVEKPTTGDDEIHIIDVDEQGDEMAGNELTIPERATERNKAVLPPPSLPPMTYISAESESVCTFKTEKISALVTKNYYPPIENCDFEVRP